MLPLLAVVVAVLLLVEMLAVLHLLTGVLVWQWASFVSAVSSPSQRAVLLWRRKSIKMMVGIVIQSIITANSSVRCIWV